MRSMGRVLGKASSSSKPLSMIEVSTVVRSDSCAQARVKVLEQLRS